MAVRPTTVAVGEEPAGVAAGPAGAGPWAGVMRPAAITPLGVATLHAEGALPGVTTGTVVIIPATAVTTPVTAVTTRATAVTTPATAVTTPATAVTPAECSGGVAITRVSAARTLTAATRTAGAARAAWSSASVMDPTRALATRSATARVARRAVRAAILLIAPRRPFRTWASSWALVV